MIRKTPKGYVVQSEGGKNLSADDLTREEAEKRLRQVEAFKALGSFNKWVKKKKAGG